MAKTSFSPGTEVTAAWANAITNPTYAQNPANDGELPAPTNADLSQAPGQIVPEWTTFRDMFAVTPGSGNLVAFQGGVVTLGSGLRTTINSGTLSLENGTHFIFVNTLGAVASATELPIRSMPMARLTMAGGALSGLIEDLRPRYTVTPRPAILSVFGSDGYEGNYTVSPGATVTLTGGLRRFGNITIGSGAIVNVTPGFLHLQASGTVTIAGTINLAPLIAGGQSFAGQTSPQSQMAANPGQGLGGAAGHNSGPAAAYPYSAENTSSSGAGGFIWNLGSHVQGADVISSTGGAGGGTIVIEAAGAISVTGTINANGGNATASNITRADTAGGVTYATGGGGGSGGLIWLQSAVGITCTAASTLSVRGGNGGNGAGANIASGPSQGGGGGGGGWIVFSSPLNQTTGSTLTVTGGTAGTAAAGGAGAGVAGSNGGSYAGQGGGGGSAGSAGQVAALNFLPI
jgi:hypothetical protein